MLLYFGLFILFIHGLIHLMGFSKAFGYRNFTQLKKEISKAIGVLWFFAALLFVLTTIMLPFMEELWWISGAAAIVISQFLIFTSWHDAKFGTIANVTFLVVVIIGYRTWSFNNTYKTEVLESLTHAASMEDSILTESDLQLLPEPVRKYLHYSGVVGKPKVRNFKVEFNGKIRANEHSEWMPFTSSQYNFMEVPTRQFFMKATMKNLPVAGYHSFENGTAFMDIRLFSLFTVQYQSGKEMNLAETVTFFNDMCCMAPATLIDNRIQWLAIEGNKVNASFTNNGITISAWLYFNDQGELINFISNDRYALVDGIGMKQLPWSTPLKDYELIKGYKIANTAETIYEYPDGPLWYGTFTLTNVDYNVSEFVKLK
jgi:hypothetical protein